MSMIGGAFLTVSWTERQTAFQVQEWWLTVIQLTTFSLEDDDDDEDVDTNKASTPFLETLTV